MSLTVKTLSLNQVKKLSSEGGISVSCIKKVKNEVVVCVHPMYAGDIPRGITEELNAMSSGYSKELGGIPIAYEKVKVSPTGGVIHGSPFIHFQVKATFYIFSPEVGSVLQGIVKKKSEKHLSCLVHEMFNVSVPNPEDNSATEWEGESVQEGDVIEIAITEIDMSFYLPMITGNLLSILSKADPQDIGSMIENYSDHQKMIPPSSDSGISDSEDKEVKQVETAVVKAEEKDGNAKTKKRDAIGKSKKKNGDGKTKKKDANDKAIKKKLVCDV